MLFSKKKNKAPQKQSNVIRVNGPCVIIKDIEKAGHLAKSDYKFIKQNLNRPLRVFEVAWTTEGSLSWFAVHTQNGCITLFPENGCTFEFV